MVAIKSPVSRSRRLVTHYLLLAFSACLFAFTILVVKNTPSSPSGVRSAHASSKNEFADAHLIYGTAWKKEKTADLVSKAIRAGFRHIDTACQPKHYNEPGVGEGWKDAAEALGLKRSDLWIQTKFTALSGQDPNDVPYDKNAPLHDQVWQSVDASLNNLQTDYLDSLVLHSPMKSFEDTMELWRGMERAYEMQKTLSLGISNCYDLDTFKLIYKQARKKPEFLQNRFHAESKFDTGLREFCKQHDIQYQSFWTLTANRKALIDPEVRDLAEAKGLTQQTYMYAFLMSLGYVTPLSGSTNEKHIAEDVDVMERIRKGEIKFTKEEQEKFAAILGMPGPV